MTEEAAGFGLLPVAVYELRRAMLPQLLEMQGDLRHSTALLRAGHVSPAVRVIDWLLLVALSTADTDTMPFASISKVTSICGTPRGAGAMPTSENLPRVLLSFANSRSPCNTWISTLVDEM